MKSRLGGTRQRLRASQHARGGPGIGGALDAGRRPREGFDTADLKSAKTQFSRIDDGATPARSKASRPRLLMKDNRTIENTPVVDKLLAARPCCRAIMPRARPAPTGWL
jgi:hypothetical protein